MNYLDKTVTYINELLGSKSPAHFDRTVYWIKEIYPKFNEELLVAGYSHDIERLVSTRDTSKSKKFLDDTDLLFHQEHGGILMHDFLVSIDAPITFANRVSELISKHEIGGDIEQNVLKDADSISYFEINAPLHATWVLEGFPKEELKSKFDWMFNRISSEAAKRFAEPLYKNALSLLGY